MTTTWTPAVPRGPADEAAGASGMHRAEGLLMWGAEHGGCCTRGHCDTLGDPMQLHRGPY